MITRCYIVEISTNNEAIFEALNDYGFDYQCEENWPVPGYMEIYIDCYPAEVRDLEEIMKWYV